MKSTPGVSTKTRTNVVSDSKFDTLRALPKILVATADAAISRVAHAALNAMHVGSMTVHDESAMVTSVHKEQPDLLILDAELPETGGLALCKELRDDTATADIPIIVIAHEASESDRIRALDSGADDCVSMPLNADELAARIRALRRRVRSHGSTTRRLRAGTIELDLDRWTAQVGGAPVQLTRMEFRLLQALLEAKGRMLSRGLLMEKAWPHSTIHRLDSRTVDVHIGRLRRKLGTAGRQIITIRNVGFRFDIQREWITPSHRH